MNLTIKDLHVGRYGDKDVSTHKTNAVALCFLFAALDDFLEVDDQDCIEDLLGGNEGYNLCATLWDGYDGAGLRVKKIVEIGTALDTKGFFADMTEEGTFGVCVEGKELALKAEMGRIEISEELGEDW
jgi:hypothetical protein